MLQLKLRIKIETYSFQFTCNGNKKLNLLTLKIGSLLEGTGNQTLLAATFPKRPIAKYFALSSVLCVAVNLN